jgi:hypothetical protein
MQGEGVRKCVTALNRVSDLVDGILQYLVAFLFARTVKLRSNGNPESISVAS